MVALSYLHRKQLGIYYTPADLARPLVHWAIRRPSDRVLEPSFGGCGFLVAARDRLVALGAHNPVSCLYGTDVDHAALDSLSEEFGLVDTRRRFLLQDYLGTQPYDFGVHQFDAIIGNPPYVSNHAASLDQRKRAHGLAARAGWDLPRTASLWAYFVLHSLTFCAKGGRLAFVLPAAFLLSNYAVAVRRMLLRTFRQVHVIDLRDRLFAKQGTDERCVLMLAEDFDRSSLVDGNLFYHDSLSEIAADVGLWRSGIQTLDDSERRAFDAVSERAVTLDKLAEMRIGTVTGANPFFLLTADTVWRRALPNIVVSPAIPKLGLAKGLVYTSSDHRNDEHAGSKSFLLTVNANRRLGLTTQAYLDTFPKKSIESNSTFRKRKLWYAIEDDQPGDALLSYMAHDSPRLVLNRASVRCTNNIHRIWWRPEIGRCAKLLATLGFLSSFTQLSAELVGRTYGGGVLKHELCEARSIEMVLPANVDSNELRAMFHQLDRLARRGLWSEARSVVDEYLLSHLFRSGERQRIIRRLRVALDIARRRRVAKLVRRDV